MSRALRLPRVMSKFWIYLSYNKTRQFTISSFHSFLMWASRLFQTGQALSLKEEICITFCIIWPLWSLTNYFEKIDALTDINAVANFGLRGLIHHGGEALIKSTTINSSKTLLVEKAWKKTNQIKCKPIWFRAKIDPTYDKGPFFRFSGQNRPKMANGQTRNGVKFEWNRFWGEELKIIKKNRWLGEQLE